MKYIVWLLIGMLLIVTGFYASQTLSAQAQEETADATTVPIPTPTIDPRQAAFEKLMQDNGGCEFPCWWGFELGKTTEDEWFTFLDALPFKVFREDPLSDGKTLPLDYGYFSFPQSTDTSYLHYDFQNGMLSKVNIKIPRPNEWLSKNVTAILFPGLLKRLHALKVLPEIYMFIGSYSSLNLPFLVVADDIGVMAQYEFKIVVSSSEPNNMHKWQYCFGLEQTNRIEITVQDPQITPKVSAGKRNAINAKESPHWVRLEDLNITPIDTNAFIQFFIDHPDDCFVPNSIKLEATEPS